MSFASKVKKKWEIVLSKTDIDIENPTKEEIIDLITASLPYKEIEAQLTRLAVHLIKTIVYKKTTRSWKITIKDAVLKIRRYNTRRKAKGVYFNMEDMQKMLRDEWNNILTWIVKESEKKWTISKLKKEIHMNDILEKMKTLKLDKRI